MEAKFGLAASEDYGEVIDFANYVFSHGKEPTDFPVILPKLYKSECFMDGMHYVARDGGRIKALVGAYPLEMEFKAGLYGGVKGAGRLKGRGIGMVAVHPYCRSRGYMRYLMNMAIDDMKRDGVVFSCLSGRRQRYEYFGFSPVGSRYSFTVNEDNIRHTLHGSFSTNISFKQVCPGDNDILDRIQSFHESKPARFLRRREKLFDILASWQARALAVYENGSFAGYIVYEADGARHSITEINLACFKILPEVIGLFLQNGKTAGMQGRVEINANPHETDKVAALSEFAEYFSLSHACHFAVFDFLKLAAPFLELKGQGYNLSEGSIIIRIEGDKAFRLAVTNSVPSIEEIDETPALCINRREALNFFFSPLAPYSFPAIRESRFLQNLLPLPLFFESADAV